ncbi:MAG: kelch repeat-containing protein [Myxococcota bacterium]
MRRFAVAFAALLALSGCGPREINYQVQIVTQACDATVDPFDGVQFLRVYVRGPDLEALDAISGANPATRQVTIPQIPPGPARVVEVRAYDGDPLSGGKVLSMGKSLPFDVPDVVPDDLMGGAIDVKVFLRKVNAFSPVVSAAAPTQCQRMKVARAGHTATELKNGKVFIAGGFNLKPGSPEKVALADTEVYNPATGAFESTKDISITSSGSLTRLPVAFHTATRLNSGQVLLWGGEVYVGGVNNTVSPKTQILVYDGDVDDFGAFPSRPSPQAIPRSRHRAALEQNGKVLIVGGYTRVSSLVPAVEVEWFDPDASSNQYKVVEGVSLPRIDAAVAAVKQGEYVAVAGGTDGSAMRNEVVFFKFNGSTFAQQSLANPPRLSDPGRRAAGVAGLRNSTDMIVVGGHSDPALVSPVASSEIISSQSATVTPGPNVGSRGDICAVTMADGTVMAVGGRTALMPASSGTSDPTSTLIKVSEQGGVTSLGGPLLPVPRYAHTCTALQDGTVLVTGGINEIAGGAQEILQDAYIYQPAPVD